MLVHVGTYEKNAGQGLVPLTIGSEGALTAGEPFAGAANASFGTRRQHLAYLVDEQDQGAVNVLRETAHGWERAARVATGGAAPCYIALDCAGTGLAVANYESGNVALFTLDGDGLLSGPPSLFQCEGSGPVAERQEGPHAHCVRFSADGEAVYCVDLGADRVLHLSLGKTGGIAAARTAWRAPPGTGPRHLLFHPRAPLAVVLSELTATLTLLDEREGMLRPRQSLATQPADYPGENLGGHLAMNAAGTRVYASNRGHDSIAVFALEDNRLRLMQHVPSGGAHPRHFAIIEEQGTMIVAHEKDGNVVTFDIAADGTLSATGRSCVIPGACFVLPHL